MATFLPGYAYVRAVDITCM